MSGAVMDFSFWLLVAAAALFALASFGVPAKIHLGWAGACVLTVALLL